MDKVVIEMINKYLPAYLTDFKYSIFIINIGTITIIGIINWFFLYSLNKKIEGFRLDNKKDEIKFKKYQIEQADAIKILYSKLIDIQNSTRLLFNTEFQSNPHYIFSQNLNKWVSDYLKFYNFYKRNRILFNNELLSLIKEPLNKLNKIFNVIFNKIKNIEQMEEICHGQLEYFYDDEFEEESKIKKSIVQLKKDTEFEADNFNINQLISALENEYKLLLTDENTPYNNVYKK